MFAQDVRGRIAMKRLSRLWIFLVLCCLFLSQAAPRAAATGPVVDPFTLGSPGAGTPTPNNSVTGASTLWTKYAGNPVLQIGPSGSWDFAGVGLPSVLSKNGGYEMWYAGSAGTKESGRIGRATSPDGVQWTKSPGNPVLTVGAPGAWDSGYVFAPQVIFHNGVYEMWYRGTDVPDTSLGAGIGYATSADGLTWTKYAGNPVLSVGPAGSWDERLLYSASVIVEGSTYKMWYSALDATNCRIGYATSPDGIHWTKHQGNPVLDVGSVGRWDSVFISYPNVIFNGSNYEMWYSGNQKSPDQIGYATSPDGIHWSKDSSNPVLTAGPAGSWESAYVDASPVILEGKTYKMWYTGSDASRSRIGYATSPRLDARTYIPLILH
jgi:predicted GH43/DUF377 family glycosyl hydrolase